MARTKQKKSLTFTTIPWQAWAGALTVIGLIATGVMFLRGCEDSHIKRIIDEKDKHVNERVDEDSAHRFWREPAVTKKLNEHDSFFRLEYPGTAIMPIQTKH